MKIEYFTCCGSPEHILRVQKGFDDDWNICMDIQLSHLLPWYKRVWVGLKFMFGSTDNQYWDSVMLNTDDVKRLKELLK